MIRKNQVAILALFAAALTGCGGDTEVHIFAQTEGCTGKIRLAFKTKDGATIAWDDSFDSFSHPDSYGGYAGLDAAAGFQVKEITSSVISFGVDMKSSYSETDPARFSGEFVPGAHDNLALPFSTTRPNLMSAGMMDFGTQLCRGGSTVCVANDNGCSVAPLVSCSAALREQLPAYGSWLSSGIARMLEQDLTITLSGTDTTTGAKRQLVLSPQADDITISIPLEVDPSASRALFDGLSAHGDGALFVGAAAESIDFSREFGTGVAGDYVLRYYDPGCSGTVYIRLP